MNTSKTQTMILISLIGWSHAARLQFHSQTAEPAATISN
jgi:hypothetical protein